MAGVHVVVGLGREIPNGGEIKVVFSITGVEPDGENMSAEDASQEATVETITVDQSPPPEDQERVAGE